MKTQCVIEGKELVESASRTDGIPHSLCNIGTDHRVDILLSKTQLNVKTEYTVNLFPVANPNLGASEVAGYFFRVLSHFDNNIYSE